MVCCISLLYILVGCCKGIASKQKQVLQQQLVEQQLVQQQMVSVFARNRTAARGATKSWLACRVALTCAEQPSHEKVGPHSDPHMCRAAHTCAEHPLDMQGCPHMCRAALTCAERPSVVQGSPQMCRAASHVHSGPQLCRAALRCAGRPSHVQSGPHMYMAALTCAGQPSDVQGGLHMCRTTPEHEPDSEECNKFVLSHPYSRPRTVFFIWAFIQYSRKQKKIYMKCIYFLSWHIISTINFGKVDIDYLSIDHQAART